MTVHKICSGCMKLGHKRDMIEKVICYGAEHPPRTVFLYYHPECKKDEGSDIR